MTVRRRGAGDRRHWIPTVLLIAAAVATASCTTRVPREDVVAALAPPEGTRVGGGSGFEPGGDDDGAATGSSLPGGAEGDAEASSDGAVPDSGSDAQEGTGRAGGRSTGGGQGAEPPPATLSPVVIGNVGDYSGPAGASLGTGRPMVAVAVKYINDHGGLNGHPVKLVVGDAAGDPGRNLSLVKDMVERQGAVALMSDFACLSQSGSDQYIREKQIPVIGGHGCTDLEYQNPMKFVPFAPSAPTQVLGMVKFAIEQGKRKYGVIYCAEAAGCATFGATVASERAKQLGGELVYSAQVSIAQPDFTAECLQARSRGAEAFFLGVEANSATRAMRSCVQQGYRPLFATTGGAADFHQTDPNAEGFVTTLGTFPWFAGSSPAEKEYLAAVKRYDPDLVLAPQTAIAWVSGMLLQKAGADLPADNPTSADLLRSLWAMRNETLGGLVPPFSFAQGAPSTIGDCYYVAEVVQGKWTAPGGTEPGCL